MDKQMIDNRAVDDPFVDATDEMSYETVILQKPMGIEFVENPEGEGGGAMIMSVKPGSPAANCGMLAPGAHLVAANDKLVYGLPFEEALEPIIEKDGAARLTFFMGDAVYLYGEFRPPVTWLLDFIERLSRDQSSSQLGSGSVGDDAQ